MDCGCCRHARRVARLEREVDDLRHLVVLIAGAAGVDLERIVVLDGLARRGGRWPSTWDEMIELGLDPITGRRAR